jgi:predicted nuclease of predicted toxin-antitoxin system
MKFLANENFPLAASKYLRENGHDVIAVGIEFKGITDREVIELANKDARTILTFDADYGELIFKYGLKPNKGVIFLKLFEFTPIEPGQIIHQLVSLPDFSTDNTLTVLHKDGIRQRKY